jgi:hypothetical protein
MMRRWTWIALLLLAGCTVKLKIGAPEISSGSGGPATCRGPGQGCMAPTDCCSQICGSAGCELPDAGAPAPDAGTRDGGINEIGARCLAYTDCASRDCAAAECVDHQDWVCDRPTGFCDTDGGFCLATNSSTGCFAFSDCCNEDCDHGRCKYSSPDEWPPSQGDPDGGGCLIYGVCTFYTDCCSGICFRGACASPSPFCFNRGTCVNYTDCCSFDCRDGLCRDSSLQ